MRQNATQIPRLIISACGSGSGKTTLMLALLAAFRNKGICVQSLKCGPDYIDPMFHSRITGRPTYHTDPFFSDAQQLRQIIAAASADADFTLIEGAMGFYDGLGTDTACSTYSVASATKTPVLLAVNPKGMGCSVGALCRGFLEYRRENQIAGVILNQIRPSMYDYYRTIIEEHAGLHVYGYLPPLEQAHLNSRHLGLMTADEIRNFDEIIEILEKAAQKTIHLDEICQLAETAAPLIYPPLPKKIQPIVRLGVARDAAFCFYYAENLKLLELLGTEIVPFSPLTDTSLPEHLDGIYLGGGYPELYAKQLSKNLPFLTSLRQAVQCGIPVFAECGGFLYLQNQITDSKENTYAMAGILQGDSCMKQHLVRFGYITLLAQQDTLLVPKGSTVRAHEFHYADSTENGLSFLAQKPNGKNWTAIQQQGNVMAGFPHLYFPSCPDAARRFVEQMTAYHTHFDKHKPFRTF